MLGVIRPGLLYGKPLRFALAAAVAWGACPGVASAADEGPPLGLQGDLAFWSMVAFLILLALLGRFAWKPLIAGLDQREARIRQDIAAAEQNRLKTEQLVREHSARLDRVQEEVKAILDEARRDAEVARQNILADAHAEIDAARKRALVEVERSKDQALKELFDATAAQVADATEHILGRKLSEEDHNRLVQEALAEFVYKPV